jgi:hypothetical protein
VPALETISAAADIARSASSSGLPVVMAGMSGNGELVRVVCSAGAFGVVVREDAFVLSERLGGVVDGVSLRLCVRQPGTSYLSTERICFRRCYPPASRWQTQAFRSSSTQGARR